MLKSGILVSLMTMISRLFGLVRDMTIAYFFGAGAGADAFILAFRIPNFFRRLFAEGALSTAAVPVLSEYRVKRTREDVRDLAGRVAGTLGLSLTLLTLLGILGADLLMGVVAAGYVYHNETHKLALATDMLRLTFPYLLLISMTAFSGSILNTFGKFAAPAFTPVLLNLSLILCALFLRPYLTEPVMALAWGVLIAGVIQLTFQLPFLSAEKLLPRPRVAFRDEGVKRIMTLMLPAVFGASVSQINLLVDTLLVSFLATGSVSWLYYSDRLLELPLALFGITIATVILPGLSREHATASPGAFSATLHWAMRLVFMLGMPASVALVLLSEELIAALFYQGEMTATDVSMSGLALAAYGAGLLGHMLVKVLAPGYFARQNMKTPVRFGVVSLVVNMVLNLILIWHLKHVGLALATSIAAFLNAGLLFAGLKRQKVLRPAPEWAGIIWKVLTAVVIMGVCLVLITPDIEDWMQRGFFERLLRMVLICTVGTVVYAATLFALGIRPHHFLRQV